MPQDNSDNQAMVDRDKSVFEVQKEDVQRLLGDDRPKRPEPPDGKMFADFPGQWAMDAWDYIEHLEQSARDAQAVLDNMEEEMSIAPRDATHIVLVLGDHYLRTRSEHSYNLRQRFRGLILDPPEGWKCIQCGSVQPATNERCKDCGQKRPEPPEDSKSYSEALADLHQSYRPPPEEPYVRTLKIVNAEGRGEIVSIPPTENCPDCRGTGWRNMATCRTCEGSGIKRPPEDPEKEAV